MKHLILLVFTVVALTGVTHAQSMVANPGEQVRIKPLIQAETKAREALNAKIATLPESKAYKDAQDALQKAADALNKAAERLPESTAWKAASVVTLDEAYKILAAHALSSREFKPELNEKGDLIFTKTTPPKP